MEVIVSNDIPSKNTHQIHYPQIMYTPGEDSVPKLVKELWNVKFLIF